MDTYSPKYPSVVFFFKHCSLSATVCWTGKCDGNDQGYAFFFPQKHFPQIISFMVDWLRTLGCRFPYLTWGWGVAVEE